MSTYSFADLKKATEKKIGRALTEEQWESLAPYWSEPYDDADLREVLEALGDSTQDTFESACSRLSWIISLGLEETHAAVADHARLLNASGWQIRPLGEFWAWSWFYSYQSEREVLTGRRLDTHEPAMTDRLGAIPAFGYAPPETTTILYYFSTTWSFSGKRSVKLLHSSTDRPWKQLRAFSGLLHGGNLLSASTPIRSLFLISKRSDTTSPGCKRRVPA